MTQPRGLRNAKIGVRNVRERLTRLFPGKHRFELTDERGWVRALVELPADFASRDAADAAQHLLEAVRVHLAPRNPAS